MYLYIMRHGETEWNRERKIQGSADIALTPLGETLAAETRDGFAEDGIRFQRIYTSPLQRAVRTAEIIDERQHAGLRVDPRIREMSFGKYEGTPFNTDSSIDENIRNCFTVPSLYRPDPTGESFEELYVRVKDFLENEIRPLEQDKNIENVLAVCHGAILRAFLTTIRGMELDEFWTIRQPNCSVNQIRLENGVFVSEKENILYYDPEEIFCRKQKS